MNRSAFALAPALLSLVIAGCGGDKSSSPTTPTPTPTPTKAIALEGDLNFGDVTVGATAEKQFRIVNRNATTLNISGMTGPAGFTADWTNGAILSNQWRDVTVRFSPTAQQSYSGTMTVNGDHTSGTNTMAINARGVRPLFSRSGTGDNAFDAPADLTRVKITGTYNGNSSNFIVKVGGRLVVNELVGTFWNMTRYEGTHQLAVSGVVEITNSSGVAWTIEEVR